MSGRNWTRRSIEELVRAYMKKQSGGIKNLAYDISGVMMDSTNVLPTTSYPHLLYQADIKLNNIVTQDDFITEFEKAYGRLELGEFRLYMKDIMDAHPNLPDRGYGLLTVPFRDANNLVPTMSRYGAYTRQIDNYFYYSRFTANGTSECNVYSHNTNFENTTFYMLTFVGIGPASILVIADKDLVLKSFGTFNDVGYPDDCPNYDTVSINGGQIYIRMPDPSTYGGTLLAHSAIAEMGATNPFNGTNSLNAILICNKDIDDTKTIEDYVNDWVQAYEPVTVTYKY